MSALNSPDYASSNHRILIIDDENAICVELEKYFASIGINSYSITSPDDLEKALSEEPDLVLLDIWMPGKDGLEVLSEILEKENPPTVMMMSGHASISTAVRATQMGASDFLEKPLDLEVLTKKVVAALGIEEELTAAPAPSEPTPEIQVVSHLKPEQLINPRKDIFGEQPFKGTPYRQKTLRHSTILYGQGLHSGRKSGISLEPLPENSGIHFIGVSQDSAVPAHVEFVESTGFATSLKRGDMTVKTIEHLLSALHAYGISNLLIKCNEEVPVFDGSALDFCRSIEEVGVVEQSGDWYALRVTETVNVDTNGELITLSPLPDGEAKLVVEYELNYPEPLGHQKYEFEFTGLDSYKKEIAPARTFGFVEDVGYLQAQGLAQGGRFDNFVLYGKGGAINQELRFEDEAVRHKILDVIGDIFLLGRPIEGKIKAVMTGHSDNVALLKAIQSLY